MDQANTLRHLFGQPQRMIQPIIGDMQTDAPSSMAGFLAAAAAEQHKSCIIFDGARHGLAANKAITVRYELKHVLLGDKFLEDVCVPTTPTSWLVPSYRGVQELCEYPERLNRLRANFHRLPLDPDILLATLPTGAIDLAFQMSEHHTKWLWVVMPTPHSVTSVYKALKTTASRFPAIDHRIVVALANSADEADHVFSSLADVCQRLLSMRLEYGGFLPSSKVCKVRNAVQGGYSDSPHGGPVMKSLDFNNVGLRVAKAMMSRTNIGALA